MNFTIIVTAGLLQVITIVLFHIFSPSSATTFFRWVENVSLMLWAEAFFSMIFAAILLLPNDEMEWYEIFPGCVITCIVTWVVVKGFQVVTYLD